MMAIIGNCHFIDGDDLTDWQDPLGTAVHQVEYWPDLVEAVLTLLSQCIVDEVSGKDVVLKGIPPDHCGNQRTVHVWGFFPKLLLTQQLGVATEQGHPNRAHEGVRGDG